MADVGTAAAADKTKAKGVSGAAQGIATAMKPGTNAEAVGNSHGADTLGFLIRALFPAPEPEPNAKPSLRIV